MYYHYTWNIINAVVLTLTSIVCYLCAGKTLNPSYKRTYFACCAINAMTAVAHLALAIMKIRGYM